MKKIKMKFANKIIRKYKTKFNIEKSFDDYINNNCHESIIYYHNLGKFGGIFIIEKFIKRKNVKLDILKKKILFIKWIVKKKNIFDLGDITEIYKKTRIMLWNYV
jgi:hypothetical protein